MSQLFLNRLSTAPRRHMWNACADQSFLELQASAILTRRITAPPSRYVFSRRLVGPWSWSGRYGWMNILHPTGTKSNNYTIQFSRCVHFQYFRCKEYRRLQVKNTTYWKPEPVSVTVAQILKNTLLYEALWFLPVSNLRSYLILCRFSSACFYSLSFFLLSLSISLSIFFFFFTLINLRHYAPTGDSHKTSRLSRNTFCNYWPRTIGFLRKSVILL
jgi:hypothetical protein